MLLHNVYFWVKEEMSAGERRSLEQGLASLCGYELVRSGHYGVPAGTTRDVVDRSYTYGLVLVFDDRAAQDAYQVSPTHQEFVQDHGDKWEKVVVYDLDVA